MSKKNLVSKGLPWTLNYISRLFNVFACTLLEKIGHYIYLVPKLRQGGAANQRWLALWSPGPALKYALAGIKPFARSPQMNVLLGIATQQRQWEAICYTVDTNTPQIYKYKKFETNQEFWLLIHGNWWHCIEIKHNEKIIFCKGKWSEVFVATSNTSNYN